MDQERSDHINASLDRRGRSGRFVASDRQFADQGVLEPSVPVPPTDGAEGTR